MLRAIEESRPVTRYSMLKLEGDNRERMSDLRVVWVI